MNKKSLSIIFNELIIIFEAIGFILTIFVNNRISYEYYTEDSNILMMLASAIYVFFLLRNKKAPRWLATFKYMATICLTITFFVVLFVLIPMYNFDFQFLLFDRSLFLQHLVCPVLSIITFLFFDDLSELSIKDDIIGMSMTILYGVVLIILNELEIVTGPYPFLMVKDQSIIMSGLWSLLLLSLGYIIIIALRKLYIKWNWDK